jgi:superfamily II DNA helicase RecQ
MTTSRPKKCGRTEKATFLLVFLGHKLTMTLCLKCNVCRTPQHRADVHLAAMMFSKVWAKKKQKKAMVYVAV